MKVTQPTPLPQKIERVYTLEFMPYVVFVKPPRIEELRLTRRRAKFICDEGDKSTVRTFSVRHSEHVSDTCEGVRCLLHVFHTVDLGPFYETRGVPELPLGRLMFPIEPAGGTCCTKVDI